MINRIPRREALARLGATGASALWAVALPVSDEAASRSLRIGGQQADFVLTAVTPHTLRISLLPIEDGRAASVADSPIFADNRWPEPMARIRSVKGSQTLAWHGRRIRVSADRLALRVALTGAKPIQTLAVNLETGTVDFRRDGKIFGLGEGGPQFDRRGQTYPMLNGERVLDLAVDGARVPIPWLVSTAGSDLSRDRLLPSGWNTGHGSFAFNSSVFPDPGSMIQQLHQEHFKVVLHVVNPPKGLHGRANDTGPAAEDDADAAQYWRKHLEVFRRGADGWWADEGDALNPIECLVRNRMYWEGPQIERPADRPYALNRNGYAGLQRYGWLWSGDIDSTWEVLRAQIAVGLNTGLSGIPYWGTDTGGFVTTKELTGELYVRWFQFSCFCPLFRSHGRTWKLRLPWQWNTGDYGPTELQGYHGKAALPDPKELHNLQVEPICRKYLDLRSRLMPYTYTVVRESHDTGLPVMRALWLHYPDDLQAVERSEEYLWGRDILVAPITEQGVSEREVYLPPGAWYDFWTEEAVQGGRAVTRAVDLATLPLFVRAGAVLPTGPVRQFDGEPRNEPLRFTVYPGADGEFVLYEDDGTSFKCEQGEFMRLRARWSNRDRQLTLSLTEGSRLLGARSRKFSLRLAGDSRIKQVVFDGTPVTVGL